jgi:hypothetical protein
MNHLVTRVLCKEDPGERGAVGVQFMPSTYATKTEAEESELQRVDATEYRSLVGSSRYLVNTRPDLAFSVGYVSRYMEDPHEDHLAAVKQILRYVVGSSDVGVFYPRRSGGMAELQGYSDSDLAGDLDSRKSTIELCSSLEEAL